MEKVALFELGNTSIRLTLSKVIDNEYFYVYKELSEFVNIDKHIEADGLIKSAKIAECIALLQIYKKICEAEGIKRFVCIASPTLAESKNYSSFIDEARNVVGLDFRMLTSDEEVSAVYAAVVNTLDIPKGIIINISGHSVRIINYSRRVILGSVILPFGSATLFQKVEGSKDLVASAVSYTLAELDKKASFLNSVDPETSLVGISDTFTSFARISRKMRKYPVDIDHNYHADAEQFTTVFNFLKNLDPEKKQKLKGISNQSVDTILAGMCIVEAILQYSKLHSLITGTTYRNIGLMLNLVLPFTNERPMGDVLGYSLDAIAATAGLDIGECKRQYALALMLFKQLRVLHKLTRGYAKILRIASYLYHFGKRVNPINFEKLNYPAIMNCGLSGATHREIVLAAFVASQKKWEDFNIAEYARYRDVVTPEDVEAVRKLSVMVSMAEALNIRNNEAVKDISCDILGDSVILKLISEESEKASKIDVNALYMEILYAKKYGAEFAKAFKKNLEIL
jgi:exopolyphosphatase/guanosine-5'-triphosphate,3'-diphosphate pyrophosphatase